MDTSQTISETKSAQLHSALASYHEKLGNLNTAKMDVLRALEKDSHGR